MNTQQLFKRSLGLFVAGTLLLSGTINGQSLFPGEKWKRFERPAEAGWSEQALAEAKLISDSIGVAAFMVIYKGNVLVSWGDVKRKYLCHSMRKSFLSALYGMPVKNKKIDLDNTLEQLGIDDTVHPLTNEEKQATIRDLLKARSGVYLPAAYEGNPEKPARGSHPHGTFWLYNNWDFNTLGYIMEQKTGLRFFDDLQQRITRPLGMEDVDSLDVYYDYELKRSQYPAYTFKMSTRDLARFGWLFCMNGAWRNKQLLPPAWISESTKAYSDDGQGNGYGYLWWTEDSIFKNRGMYHAAGKGGHHIFVIPKDSLVIVVRADTYSDKFVDLNAEYRILQKIIAGKTGNPIANPQLTVLPEQAPDAFVINSSKLNQSRYLGHYQFEGEWMDVIPGKKGLMMNTELMGKFYLEQFSESLFRLKDQQNYISFLFDKNGQAAQLIYHDKSINGTKK